MIKVNPSKWEYLKESTLKRKPTVLICPKYEKRIPQGDHLLKGCDYWQKIGRYFLPKHLNYSPIKLF